MRQVLHRGSSGFLVERLQTRLAALGFNPGKIDGRFGMATEAALIGFQRAFHLLADGVCGPATWAVIDPGTAPAVIDVTPRLNVAFVAELFPYTRLDSIARNLPLMLDGLRSFGLVDKPMVLVALGTVRAESELFEAIDEEVSRFNTSPGGHAFDLYDFRSDIGNRGRPDGEKFKGRGYVQLTGRSNYTRFSKIIGLGGQLVRQPKLANDPAIAGKLLGAFLADRRLAIKEALLERDFRRVRRLVNGGSHGLERFVDTYTRGDRALPDPVWPSAVLPIPANDDRCQAE